MKFNKDKVENVSKRALLLLFILYALPFILSCIFRFFLRLELLEIYLAVEITWNLCFFIMVLAFDDTEVMTDGKH